ncbi:MAG: HD domain-containing protein [bacterium]|nr:HD domain-containing protein [bacterium]
MPKTLVEKVSSPETDVTIFKISGTLGFHENEVLVKFFTECAKKGVSKLIFDFSALTSLGGGCAKILCSEASSGKLLLCIAGASSTVRNFLKGKGDGDISFCSDLAIAVERIEQAPEPAGGSAAKADNVPEKNDDASDKTDKANIAKATEAKTGKDEDDHALRQKLVQYRALLSLKSDLNRIRDKAYLLDAFLLTVIAQVGVETAVFLERNDGQFDPICWKGFETADPKALIIDVEDVEFEPWTRTLEVMPMDKAPISEQTRTRLSKWDMKYAAPVVVHEVLRGILLLGKPIRKELDPEAMEFLAMLINQAAVAYANTCRFEEETERTLGLVHTLISMIEENTVSRGTTDLIMRYTHALATELHYPEEHMRDLMYGTVLRDIGMIKVSDLIVRSPRELQKEEWEVIKRHPIEGAEMLNKMKFSHSTQEIVMYHHERFNGEGYPERLQGRNIPMGARIVSVVESYAAMLQDRPTRPALGREAALDSLRENFGNRYDPDVILSFVAIVEEEIRTGEKAEYSGSEIFRL